MEIRFIARNTELEESFKDYADRKIEKVERFFDKIMDTAIAVTFKRGMYAVEITSSVNGMTMRGEDYSHDLRKAFDKALKNIERQVKRHKEYLKDRVHMKSKEVSFDVEVDPYPSSYLEEETGEPQIVKSKKFPIRTMLPEEAARQMDLLGHNFYLFINGNTGLYGVVYRRKEGGYGLLEPVE